MESDEVSSNDILVANEFMTWMIIYIQILM